MLGTGVVPGYLNNLCQESRDGLKILLFATA